LLCAAGLCYSVAATLGADDFLIACHIGNNTQNYRINPLPNSRLFAKETIFITARGTVGKLALVQRPMAMNQSCYALTPKSGLDNLFLFLAMEDGVEHLKTMASGGVFDTIVVDTFKRMPFVCPTAEMTKNFGNIVRPLFSQIENLLLQNFALASARDELLPKLMSGAIRV